MLNEQLLSILRRVTCDLTTGCWNWQGCKTPLGYGQLSYKGVRGSPHRMVYEIFNGSIPGKVVDHLCRNPSCCNPAHLEAVSHRVNIQRGMQLKTHCPAGHEYTEANTGYSKYGHRRCRACHRKRSITGTDSYVGNHHSRKTHCAKGHPYDEVNTHYKKTGGRDCRTCNRERARKRKAALQL